MGLTLTVLGCSGSYAGPGQACSGYLVGDGETTLWLDAGSGTLANLQRHIGLDQVDAVVLSHEHPDHWSDIEGFRVACTYVLKREDVPVYGPAGVRERLSEGYDSALRWQDVGAGDRVDIGSLRLGFSRTDHPPETLAVRIEGGGRSLAYSADTGPAWSFAALGKGIDAALCEATYPSDQTGGGGHLSAAQAGAMSRQAGVPRLLLTHLWPTVDPATAEKEAAGTYGGPVAAVVMGQSYDI